MAIGKIVRDLKAIKLGIKLDDSIDLHVWQSGAESSEAGGIILSGISLACSPILNNKFNLINSSRRLRTRSLAMRRIFFAN